MRAKGAGLGRGLALALALSLPLVAMQAGPVAAEVGGAAVTLDLFDPSDLAAEERLFLQAALALSGDYTGVLDGDWGEDSRAALNDWTRREAGRILPRLADLGPLVAALETEIVANGWQIVQSDERGVSYLFPFALLAPDPEGEECQPDSGEVRKPGAESCEDSNRRRAGMAHDAMAIAKVASE